MGKDGGSNQALKNSEGAETERRPEHGKEPVKGGHRPATFGEDEDDDLSDDQQSIDDGPKDSSRLVRDGAVPVFGVTVRNKRWVGELDAYSM